MYHLVKSNVLSVIFGCLLYLDEISKIYLNQRVVDCDRCKG